MPGLNCRFCGSGNLSDIRANRTEVNEYDLRPEVRYENLGFTAGSISKRSVRGTSHITVFCTTCRNIDAVDFADPSPPMLAYDSELKKSVIIPYVLKAHLMSLEYGWDKIHQILSCIRDRLQKIYCQWAKEGTNPCKRSRMGKKITIVLEQWSEIKCWVIVEVVKEKIYLRLSYGGSPVICP